MNEIEKTAAHRKLAQGGEVSITPPDGDPFTVATPDPWLMGVIDTRAEMGCDRSGKPFATDRFAVLDEEGVVDPALRRLVRRLWRAADHGTARGLEEQYRKD